MRLPIRVKIRDLKVFAELRSRQSATKFVIHWLTEGELDFWAESGELRLPVEH